MRKDKEKVLDEVWTEERVKSFLNVRSHDEVEEDFHMLLKAYQSMRAEDFAKFVSFFINDGRSLNARNPAGKRFWTSSASTGGLKPMDRSSKTPAQTSTLARP